MKIDWTKTGVVFLLIILAAFSRLIPHPSNFTAIGAIGIYSALLLRNKVIAAILPVVAMWLSDLIINNLVYTSFYPTFTLFSDGAIWIYVGVFGHSLFTWLFPNNKPFITITVASFLGALMFFLLSNFGVWIATDMYPKSISGLILCFTAALPFFANSLLGNLFFSLLLLAIHSLMEKKAKLFHFSA